MTWTFALPLSILRPLSSSGSGMGVGTTSDLISELAFAASSSSFFFFKASAIILQVMFSIL
jgi:hypothetical protein